MKPQPDVETIFHEALKRTTPPEREAFLDGACAGDPGLRSRAEALLVAHEESGKFLDAPAVSLGIEADGTGTRIGPYKILQEIGEGGMGVVYMAEQQEPVQRKVALKVIKLGMDTKQVIARFEVERQALAMMDHPNIAKVLDAGATETGRPYFVMELVRGVPITEYCDKNNLSLSERLDLFTSVCRAIQHAHQKGIIHRDIKPSNVLVTLHDTKPVPKIIDFGVAKATNQRLTEKTLFTEYHQFIGTPEYMSPEQAEMSGLDVDTRTDIYSLGVLLYQVLTGTTPHDADSLRAAGYGELQRIIREEEPPSLSDRVSRLGDALVEVAKHRSVEPSGMAKLFRGDLDWIVMKALEKDRSRRYETALDMAADIERHLANEPVLAHKPSTIYKLRKFVRRHRVAVVAGTIVAFAITDALVATTISYRRANREAARNAAISDSLQDILALADPDQASNADLDVDKVLATAREVFGSEHATVASTLTGVAVQLHNAGDLEAAEALYEEALGVWRRVYGEEHLQVGVTLGRLGALYHDDGRYEEAEEALLQSLSIHERLPAAGGLASCASRASLAELLRSRGEFAEAARHLRQIVAIRRERAPDQHLPIIQVLEQLLPTQMSGEDKQAAEGTMRELFAEVEGFYPAESRFVGMASIGLGQVLYDQGKLEEAEPYLRKALGVFEKHEGPTDLYELIAVDRLFQIVRRDLERAREAEVLFEQAVHAMGEVLGKTNDRYLENLLALAVQQRELGELMDAIESAVEALDAFQANANNPRGISNTTELVRRLLGEAVAMPTLSQPDYERCLSVLEEAPLERGDAGVTREEDILRGALNYRLGRREPALEALGASEGDVQDSGFRALRDAMRAMTCFQEGRDEEARAHLESLREQSRSRSFQKSEWRMALLDETESLLAGSR